MKKITLTPVALAVIALASCTLGAAFGSSSGFSAGFEKGRAEGVAAGQTTAKRDSELLIATMITAGVKVRKPDGSEAQFVLRPVGESGNGDVAAGARSGGAVVKH